jgi:hypothetical protein
MMRRMTTFVPLVLGAAALALTCWRLLPAVWACEVGDPVVEVIASWPRDQYLLVCFQGAQGAVSPAARPLEKAVKAYGTRANVKLVSSPVKGQGAEGAPAVLVSPLGMVLACFDSAPAEGEVKALFESPARGDLVRSLQKNKAVFLCLMDGKSDAGKKTVQVLKSALELTRQLSDAPTDFVVLDPSAPGEKYLVRNVSLQAPSQATGEPLVALLCGNGRVADITVGVPTEEQIVDRLQRIYRDSGLVDPSRFGEDLLLVW